jgi:hypothetical protein
MLSAPSIHSVAGLLGRLLCSTWTQNWRLGLELELQNLSNAMNRLYPSCVDIQRQLIR